MLLATRQGEPAEFEAAAEPVDVARFKWLRRDEVDRPYYVVRVVYFMSIGSDRLMFDELYWPAKDGQYDLGRALYARLAPERLRFRQLRWDF